MDLEAVPSVKSRGRFPETFGIEGRDLYLPESFWQQQHSPSKMSSPARLGCGQLHVKDTFNKSPAGNVFVDPVSWATDRVMGPRSKHSEGYFVAVIVWLGALDRHSSAP